MIRKATKNDCPAIFKLIKELALYEKAPLEVTISLEELEKSGFGNNPVYWAIVAEVENEIVGFALCYTRFSTWKGERCYLEDILVTENYRGQGIGKLLMEEVIAEAKLRKHSAVVWQVLEWNEPAIHFYKKYKANFDAEWINCSLPLQ
jgi:GNAT superfamily N-acetyltransferase